MRTVPEIREVFRYFGQAAPLPEQQFEQVRGEAPASLHVTKTELLQTRTRLTLRRATQSHENINHGSKRANLYSCLHCSLHGVTSGPGAVEIFLTAVPCANHLSKQPSERGKKRKNTQINK